MNVAYNMDCMEAMREMPDNAFDLAVVDPPYRDMSENQPTDINTMTIEERVRLYTYGDKERNVPPRSFDLSKKDAETILSLCALVRMLAKRDYPHNFQRERHDIAEYCYKMTTLQGVARELAKYLGEECND